MSFGSHLTVLLIAIFAAAAVNAQNINVNGTVEGGNNNGSNSALIGLSIIGNSTLVPLIKNTIEALKNATVNGTQAIRKAISEAARGLITNGNVTVQAITQFLQAAQRNLTALGNATLANAVDRLQKFVENNRQEVQKSINAFVTGFLQAFQSIISIINATIINFANLFNGSLPTFPPIQFPISGGAGEFFGLGRR